MSFFEIDFQFLLLTIFNLQANILTTKDILSNLELLWLEDLLFGGGGSDLEPRIILGYSTTALTEEVSLRVSKQAVNNFRTNAIFCY